MRVLVVGSGGREHALCCAISRSPMLVKLYCAPGNPGIGQVCQLVAIDAMDIPALVDFAVREAIDLVMPGPEGPLVAGIADALSAAGIMCCGPSRAAAALEGSKSFTKDLADAAGIPTARWERFDEADAARAFVRRRGAPIVVKADGLAAGKGVVVAETEEQALAAIADFMESGALGEAGRSIVIEECLVGPEISVFALCDGLEAMPLGAAQDHKRVGDGDLGPNTGGMGAYSPTPLFTPLLGQEVLDRIIHPALVEMSRRGMPFRGILYAGLMLTSDGPKLIEFNARFGDPECQVILLRLESDLLAVLLSACTGKLANLTPDWNDHAAIAVVMAAEGYPVAPVRDSVIGDLDAAAAVPGVQLFHAGTAEKDGQLVSSGGRVLTICAAAEDLRTARDAAYKAVDLIHWPKGFCRRDIGWRALN